MKEIQGRCMNFGNCDTADKGILVKAAEGDDFKCPECGKELIKNEKSGAGGGVRPKVPGKIIIGAAVFLLLCIAGYFIASYTGGNGSSSGHPDTGGEPSSSGLAELLEQGEFDRALKQAAAISSPDPDTAQIIQQMKTSIKPVIKFQYQNAAGSVSQPFIIGSPELDNLMLTHEDDFQVFAEIPQDTGELYLYIFHIDQDKKLYRLFPESKFSSVKNPVQPGEELKLPENDNWFNPDKLQGDNPVPITETLYFTASPWAAEDLDALFEDINSETDANEQERLIDDLVKRLEIRANGRYPFSYFGKLVFLHGTI